MGWGGKRAGGGRPRKPDAEKVKDVSISISPQARAKIAAAASKRNTTPRKLMRAIIERWRDRG